MLHSIAGNWNDDEAQEGEGEARLLADVCYCICEPPAGGGQGRSAEMAWLAEGTLPNLMIAVQPGQLDMHKARLLTRKCS